jgi:nitrous oxidase accessory protein
MIGNMRFNRILMFSLGGINLLMLVAMGSTAGNTIIVDDDGAAGQYELIQDAIDNATTGDTIRVFEGEYVGGLTVNRSVSIIGNGSSTTKLIGQGLESNVIFITSDSVNLRGFSIIGPGKNPSPISEILSNAGIRISSSWNAISDIRITNSYFGIQMTASHSTTISNLTIDECSKGIDLMLSTNSIITGTEITNSLETAIYLSLSSYNSILNNSIFGSGISGIHFANANFNRIEENHLQDNQDGINLTQTQDNRILGNTIILHEHGILVNGSTRTTLDGNQYVNNRYGLYLYHSHENDLNHSSFSNNSRDIVINDSTTNDLSHLPPSTNVLIIESEKSSDDQFEIPDWIPMVMYGILVTVAASVFFQRRKKAV